MAFLCRSKTHPSSPHTRARSRRAPAKRMWLNVSHRSPAPVWQRGRRPGSARRCDTSQSVAREIVHPPEGDRPEAERKEGLGQSSKRNGQSDDETEKEKQLNCRSAAVCKEVRRAGWSLPEEVNWERQFMISGVTIN